MKIVGQLSSTWDVHGKFLHLMPFSAHSWPWPGNTLSVTWWTQSIHYPTPTPTHSYSDTAAVQSPSGVKGNILMLIPLETGTCWPGLSPGLHKDNRKFNKAGLEPRGLMVPLFTTLPLLSSSCHLKDRGGLALWKQKTTMMKAPLTNEWTMEDAQVEP